MGARGGTGLVMMTYFSDREFGPRPMVEDTVGRIVWQAVLSLIETRVNDGSMAHGFPSHCEDGNAIVGTDKYAMWNAISAEIGELADQEAEEWSYFYSVNRSADSWPNTPAILDLIEFVARHVAQPTQSHWHDFSSHHHLRLDRKEGLCQFVEDINRLFSRNGLAYKLTETGVIERTVPTPVAERLKRTEFRTGDHDLDDLLGTAINRYLLPGAEARQDALEKLWDAFERLKTIEVQDKKAGATILIDKAVAGDSAVFRSAITEEFKVMTRIGNKLGIRHSEVGQEPLGDHGEKDYLFMRLFSLIWLMLKGTGRLSEIHSDDADDEDESLRFLI